VTILLPLNFPDLSKSSSLLLICPIKDLAQTKNKTQKRKKRTDEQNAKSIADMIMGEGDRPS
jgi:hypothetical protein